MSKIMLAASFTAAALVGSAIQAATLSALSTFGGGDGWRAPGEIVTGDVAGTATGTTYNFLGTANNERGLAFGNGHVYVVSRTGGNFVRILDAATGADIGNLNTTGITGGTNQVNAAAVGSDGAIYVGNLTTQSTTSPYKIYKWATEAGTSTLAYSGDAGLPGARVGDSMAMTGANRIAAGYGSTPVVAGNNGYSIVDVATATATAVGFTGTPPNAGDFRLGITFTDSSHVLGTQGSSLYRYTSFSGSTGTLIASPAIPDPAGATADRLLAYAVIGGVPILAVQSIGDSHVSIYDVTNPAAPVYLTSKNNTTGTLTANSNGSGQLAWSYSGSGPDATLYALSTNQGVQAFSFNLPEPTSLLSLGAAGVLGLRRRK